MLNPIETFKVAILHLNRDWNHLTAAAGVLICLLRGLWIFFYHEDVYT